MQGPRYLLRYCMRLMSLLLTAMLGLGVVCFAEPAERQSAEEKLLQAAGLATDGPALLDFFRKRTRTQNDRSKIDGLIKRLGDEDFAAREEAGRQLVALGAAAVPALEQATKDADAEISSRARKCLEALPADADLDVLLAAARLLAQRKPSGF